MGGVDLLDSYLGRSKIKIKSKKWYIRLFYHLLDLTVVNSWILFKKIRTQQENSSKITLVEFKSVVAQCLTDRGIQKHSRGRPSINLENKIQAKKRRGPAMPLPPKDVRRDQLSH